MPNHDSGNVLPTQISCHAWEAALAIDNEIAGFLAEFGLRRSEGRSRITEVIATMVQLAINRDRESDPLICDCRPDRPKDDLHD